MMTGSCMFYCLGLCSCRFMTMESQVAQDSISLVEVVFSRASSAIWLFRVELFVSWSCLTICPCEALSGVQASQT